MAFCGSCGKYSNATFCQSCGVKRDYVENDVEVQTPAIATSKASKASLKTPLVGELREFRLFTLVWFLLILPVLFSAALIAMHPAELQANLETIALYWLMYSILGVLAIQPLRWVRMGSWKARRRAAWLFAGLGLLTFPSDQVPGAIRVVWFIGSAVFYYFTLSRTLNSDNVKSSCNDFENVPSSKKRIQTAGIAVQTTA